MMNPKTFLFFGRSGSGKGTQADLLIKYLNQTDSVHPVLYLETGSKAREFIKEPSFSSKTTKEIMERGGLLPEFLPVWIWSNFLIENYTGQEHVVLDGLSRRRNEASILDSAFKFYKMEKPYVFLLNVSEEWARERLLKRGRMDDNERDIDARLGWFYEVSAAIDFFKKSDYYTFIEINAEQTADKVHADILTAIKS